MHTKSAKNGLERDLVNEKQNKKVRPGPGARLGERRKPQKNMNWSTIWCTKKITKTKHDLEHEAKHKTTRTGARFGARGKTTKHGLEYDLVHKKNRRKTVILWCFFWGCLVRNLFIGCRSYNRWETRNLFPIAYIPAIQRCFPKMVPPNHPLRCSLNHPAIGVPPWETTAMTSSPSSVVDPTVVVHPGPLDDQPRTTRTRDCPTPGTALMGRVLGTWHEEKKQFIYIYIYGILIAFWG